MKVFLKSLYYFTEFESKFTKCKLESRRKYLVENSIPKSLFDMNCLHYIRYMSVNSMDVNFFPLDCL